MLSCGESVLQFIMLSVITFVVLFAIINADEFVTDPQSVTVSEGENVTLSCESDIYDYRQSCDNYMFYWLKDVSLGSDIYLSKCHTVYSDFSSRMTAMKNDGRYTLNIHQVLDSDSGEYYCYVNGESISPLRSAEASLRVIPSPPLCDVVPNSPTVGTTVKLRCKLSEQASESSLLTWLETASGEEIHSEPSGPTKPGGYYTANLVVTELDNYKEFTCVAGPDQEKGSKCIITPLQVKTNVSISPNSSVTIYEGGMASFRCISESVPNAHEFRWRVRKNNGSEDKVNINKISSLGVNYELSEIGQELKIFDASIASFNNTAVRCIAINTLESVRSGESLLIVLPAAAIPTEKSATTDTKRSNSSSRSVPGLIVGGVLGVFLLLAIIAILGCYLLRNKRTGLKERSTKSRFQKSSARERLTMTVVQASPTYEEVPQDIVRRNETESELQDDTATSALYAMPDKAKRGGESQNNVSPTYANSSGYVNLPRHGEQHPPSSSDDSRRVVSGHVKYAVPDKSGKSRLTSEPSDCDSTSAVLRQNDDPKQKNAEGLVYADLELESPRRPDRVENDQQADESINYASIRGDLAEVRGLLSRN